MLSNDQWKCPVCNSDNLDYGSLEIDGDQARYDRECSNCWSKWYECYVMEFTEQEVTEKSDLYSYDKEDEKRVW